MPRDKVILAYSGGLDTSVLMSWIKEKYNAEMIGFCADIGQVSGNDARNFCFKAVGQLEKIFAVR